MQHPSSHLRRGIIPLFAFFLFCAVPFHVEGARTTYSYEEDKSVMLREILDSIEQLRHEVRNHESEIRTFDEKFRNQEDILDSVRQQTVDALKTVKEALKNQISAVDAKLASHENATKGISADLKTHANDSVTALTDYKVRISELEKSLDAQNRNVDNLQQAMRSLAEILQTKEGLVPDSTSLSNGTGLQRIYRVKAGDTLDKIAKQNSTSIKKIKDLNHLTKDQIMVGQKLQLPDG